MSALVFPPSPAHATSREHKAQPLSASSHAPAVFKIFKAPLFPDGYEQEGAHCLRVTLASDATPPLQADISCSFDAFPSEPSLGEKHIEILVRL
jgi:hypothetical protein